MGGDTFEIDIAAACAKLGVSPVPEGCVTPAQLLQARFSLHAQLDANLFAALRQTAEEQHDFEGVWLHDWFSFLRGAGLKADFKDANELLATKTMEYGRGDDDRAVLFNPIGNYRELIQAAVKQSPHAVVLAHLPPVLHRLCEACFDKLDSVSAVQFVSPTVTLQCKVRIGRDP